MPVNSIIHNSAATVEIHHPTASWGTFCFNDKGDLFLNSDWGMFAYGWRSFGDDFQDFLAQTNPEYIVGKFAINYTELTGKRLPKHKEDGIRQLVFDFIQFLNQ